MNKPLVSIFCVSYNHEQFIAQALDGFVMQKTNFDYEIVISDDCSTDNTKSIINEYIKKYPKLFKDVSPRKNLGMQKNWLHTLNACTGKYIALCEGDDYWTDANKLQKQVDFLEENEDCILCFHKTEVNDLIKKTSDFNFAGYFGNGIKYFTIQDFFHRNFAATASVIFEKKYIENTHFFSKFPVGDYLIHLTVLLKSGKKAIYLPESMAVYTNHWGGHGKKDEMIVYYKDMLKFFINFRKYIAKMEFNKEIIEQEMLYASRACSFLYKKKRVAFFKYFYFFLIKKVLYKYVKYFQR